MADEETYILTKEDFQEQQEVKCTLFTGHPVRRVHFALYD